jgi:hypothetical protein
MRPDKRKKTAAADHHLLNALILLCPPTRPHTLSHSILHTTLVFSLICRVASCNVDPKRFGRLFPAFGALSAFAPANTLLTKVCSDQK